IPSGAVIDQEPVLHLFGHAAARTRYDMVVPPGERLPLFLHGNVFAMQTSLLNAHVPASENTGFRIAMENFFKCLPRQLVHECGESQADALVLRIVEGSGVKGMSVDQFAC